VEWIEINLLDLLRLCHGHQQLHQSTEKLKLTQHASYVATTTLCQCQCHQEYKHTSSCVNIFLTCRKQPSAMSKSSSNVRPLNTGWGAFSKNLVKGKSSCIFSSLARCKAQVVSSRLKSAFAISDNYTCCNYNMTTYDCLEEVWGFYYNSAAGQAWHSGRTSNQLTFTVLCLTCSWWVTTYVGKLSAKRSAN